MTRRVGTAEQGDKIPQARLWLMKLEDFLPKPLQEYDSEDAKLTVALLHQYQQGNLSACFYLIKIAAPTQKTISKIVKAAIEKCQSKLVVDLVESRVFSDEQFREVFSALLECAAPIDLINRLFDRINVAEFDLRYDLLTISVMKQRYDVVGVLLDSGVDSGAPNSFGTSAVSLAIFNCSDDSILTRLLNACPIDYSKSFFSFATQSLMPRCELRFYADPYHLEGLIKRIKALPPEMCGLDQMQSFGDSVCRQIGYSPALSELVQRSSESRSVKKKFICDWLINWVHKVSGDCFDETRPRWPSGAARSDMLVEISVRKVIARALKSTTVESFGVMSDDSSTRAAYRFMLAWKAAASQMITALNHLGFTDEEFDALYTQMGQINQWSNVPDFDAIRFIEIERQHLRGEAKFSMRKALVLMRDERRLGNDQRLFARGGGGAGGGAGAAASADVTAEHCHSSTVRCD